MSEIKRWDIAALGNGFTGMTQRDDGAFVRNSDHEAEVARLRAEVEGLAQSLTEAFEADKEQSREISEIRTNLEKYQKAVRKIRARADSEGTAKQHGMQYVAGLRNAANMIDAAMGASA
ncbi:hypothetical protein [Stenotrophomonas sp. 59]|uniref:hypothetical protein n=1 Tax=Stenotrophomonas sp. 59 TaxID=3051120 RepID=UPI00256ED531|nr:hypothetical protein [Stenotrophomonas sp. 59]